MSIINTSQFLNIVKNNEKIDNFKLGKIDSNYISGRPKIKFDSETIVSEKQYCYLDSYIPKANDRVLLMRISGTFIILGKII